MTILEAYKTTRMIEALENYAVSDDHSIAELKDTSETVAASDRISSDKQFWASVLDDPVTFWGKEIRLKNVGLSEWVARVPGLYWSKGSRHIRLMAKNNIEHNNYGLTFTPIGKTQQVLGGVGTFKFAPDEFSRKLVILSCDNNASTGIPALISPEVWEHHRLEEGTYLSLKGVWREMSAKWAERFPSIKGIPRGFLVIDKPDQVTEMRARDVSMSIQPCSILKYESQGGLFYDFVYCTSNSNRGNHREGITNFFNKYKNDHDHPGKYLIEMDVSLPMLGAEYNSPEALLEKSQNARSHLNLIEERIKEESFNNHTIDNIISAVNQYCDNDTLKRLSQRIGIEPNSWFRDTAVVNSAVDLIDVCLEKDHLDEFVDALVQWNPDILFFNQN